MKVTIVTPSFNQGRFIGRTLDSVAAQHVNGIDIEHLVFDGGSTDGTIDVLRRAQPLVRWTSAPDHGQADAVNQGLAAATGDVIGWLNSDDVYYAGAISRVVRFLDAHPEIDVVYGRADHIDADDRVLDDYPTEPWHPERLKERCIVCQPAVFVRRSVVARFGLLDESLHYCMDYEYWLRLARDGARFALVDDKLAGSRLYAENKTLGSRLAVHREINDMLARLFGRVPDAWLYAYAHAEVEARSPARRSLPVFAIRVGLASVRAALRWNRGVSRAMVLRLARRLRTATERAERGA